ncbi:hypothetical protein CHU95_09275 [Niveispirillum lacus]|uniref:SPOR domain-containing protein n=1 Tax=Niveispirillum lacus TaxID=1981099 RepID=A0A255Z030_9PROT|nr:SPOR domain-containing protein [Niveispirillum lacus]OYQ34779.1 hypothetical protein CHU95_09275 [Niveispirillum lacus]
MPQPFRPTGPAALLLSLALLTAQPALADLQAGRLAFFAGDYATAFKEFSKAADTGDSSGQYLAGEMLVQGRGIPKDVRQGMRLLEAAAAGGHVGAQSLTGALYAFGQDMPADYTKALAYLRPAAQAGDMNAQNNLAALLYFGLGTPQDLVDGLHWAKRASAKRLVAAIKLEQEIQSRATPDQIKEAQARALRPLDPPAAIASPKTAAGPKPDPKVTPKPAAPVTVAKAPVVSAPPASAPPVSAPVPATTPPPPPVTTAAAPVPAATAPAIQTAPNIVAVARPAPAVVAAPVPAPPPPASPATAAVPVTGGWVIQVGSLPTRMEAEKHWKALAAKQADLLGGRQPTLVEVDLGAKGLYTRVLLTGFADQTGAAALCARLKAAGSDCLVRKAT